MLDQELTSQVETAMAGVGEEYDGLPVDVGSFLNSVLNAILPILSGLDIRSLPLETKAMILGLIESSYNRLLRPLDIPYVPNLIENRVDDAILVALLVLSKQILGV